MGRPDSRRVGVYSTSMNDNASERAAFEPKTGRWPANLMLAEPMLGEHDRFFLVPVVRDPTAHPAAKPVQLMAHLVRLFIPRGGSVLDPFAGSGATAAAAIATGRRAILVEKDPSFAAEAGRALGVTPVAPAPCRTAFRRMR